MARVAAALHVEETELRGARGRRRAARRDTLNGLALSRAASWLDALCTILACTILACTCNAKYSALCITETYTLRHAFMLTLLLENFWVVSPEVVKSWSTGLQPSATPQ